MRLGSRRGRSIAGSLRITIRDDDKKDGSSGIPSPESPDSPDSPDSPSSSSSTFTLAATSTKEDDSPSPTKTTFSTVKTTKTDSPSPTKTTFPPSSVTSTTSNTLVTSTQQPVVSTVSSITTSTLATSTLQPAISTTSSITSNTLLTSTLQPAISTTSSITSNTLLTSTPQPVVSTVSSITSSALLPSTLQPAISTTSQAPLSTSLSITAEPELSATTATKKEVSTTISSVATNLPQSNGLGPGGAGDRDPPLSGASSVGIALGVGAGLALLVSLLFFLWKKHMGRKALASSSETLSPPPPPANSNRYTHRSDDRIINDFIGAAYAAENGPENAHPQQNNVNGYADNYIDEKKGGMEGNNIPAMPPMEPSQGDTKLKHTVSSWLSRQSQQMLNPMFARASIASSAQGLKPIDLRSMSGWGDDDDRTQYGRNEPPPPLPSNPMFNNNGQGPDGTPSVLRPGNTIQPGAVSLTPPAPTGLKLPPPPVRPISVSARTEATSVTTGTWNTWGVEQHRNKPKGFKEKLGL